ncbi:hypothetical protein [Saccharomonospora sp. CUA-673]|uniref:carboxylate-amine ligase n=1 Tax=Saccharomonospora sp. CUA-673 TaxID=1904969 RepID=UPI0021008F7C|nr:hypothetical protein [Saccharomonospora sp. CUA-673]
MARPSPTLPTVEVRVADTAITPDESLLQALLVRGLVDTALSGAADETEPCADDTVLSAGVWAAARYGLAGRGVDPWTAQARPASELAQLLLDHIRPALEAAGDLERTETLLAHLLGEGTGAQRQRRAASDGIWKAMLFVADETVRDL